MGFLNLIAFGYLSAISLVVLIYFFSKKKNIIEVSSIIPWEIIKDDIVRSRLFRIDLLFILQILLLLLLTFFLARPFLKSSIVNISGKNIILIIDSSASMQAVEPGGPRFDQAKSQALKMVSKMSRWDKMMVINTNYSSVIASDFTENKRKLNEAINKLIPRDTGTNLDEGIGLGASFLKNVERGEMYVLTDQTPSSVNMAKQENIKFIKYGKNSTNAAITSLDVFQDMFKDYKEREAYVTVKNYSDNDTRGMLNVFLNNEKIDEKDFELNGHEQKTLKTENLTASGVLKAEIQINDFLSVDNTAYALINEIKPIDILLVSDDNILKNELEKIQYTTHRIKITTVGETGYTPEVLKNYDVAIFHKYVPDSNPDINSLYIFPLANRANNQTTDAQGAANFSKILIPNQRLVENARIIDLDDTHPAMRHLDNLDEVGIRNALEIITPDWSTSIIKIAGRSNDSSIAFAGTYAGKRIIALGFDLSAFDFSRADSLKILILTLNLIQWLNPYEIEGHNRILTGEQYIPDFAVKGKIEILNPKGEIFKYDLSGDIEKQFVFSKIEHIGEYNISGDNFSGRFVANLYDEKESNIRPDLIVDEENKFEEKESVTSIEDKKNEFSRYLLLLVPLILLIEWLLFYKRVRIGTA